MRPVRGLRSAPGAEQSELPFQRGLERGLDGAPEFPRLPQRRRKRRRGTLVSFLLMVLVPVAMAAVYYGTLASPQYVSEFRFAVQDTKTGVAPSLAANQVASLLGASQSPSSSHNFMVIDYLTSRQAVEELQSRIKVADLYARGDIDWWARFEGGRPIEDFVRYWQGVVSADYDIHTGLAWFRVRAFSARDAHLIANSLVRLSEELINGVAMRAKDDAVRFAEKEVRAAEDRLKAARAKLTDYRNRYGVIDPNVSVVASNAQLVQTLRASLAQLETNLAALTRQNMSANSPTIQILRSQIEATKKQIAAVDSQVAKSEDGRPLSAIVAQYEQLDLERQFAQAMVTSTMQALDQARANAAAQSLYITPYVRPSLPQSATHPRALRSVALVAVFAFIGWTICLLAFRSIREHYA
jgi:capsular polysaccharide transport system permease protein